MVENCREIMQNVWPGQVAGLSWMALWKLAFWLLFIISVFHLFVCLFFGIFGAHLLICKVNCQEWELRRRWNDSRSRGRNRSVSGCWIIRIWVPFFMSTLPEKHISLSVELKTMTFKEFVSSCGGYCSMNVQCFVFVGFRRKLFQTFSKVKKRNKIYLLIQLYCKKQVLIIF